jgi:hypothetical protein
MITAIVQVSAKIVELLKYREQREEKQFKATVEPTFVALQRIHKDYLLMFHQVEADLEAQTGLHEVWDQLEENRLQEETARRTIELLAVQLQRSYVEGSGYQFFGAVCAYFGAVSTYIGESQPENSHLSESNTLSRSLRDAIRWEFREGPGEPMAREFARNAVKAGAIELRRKWNDVAKAYAALMADYLY